jgi:hypothetical protein
MKLNKGMNRKRVLDSKKEMKEKRKETVRKEQTEEVSLKKKINES